MFSATKNPYTESVTRATDEKQTAEDWGSLLAIWEKVNAEGDAGARNVIAAIVQRLQHRNANVQLFSLTLADALVKNCGKPLHHEIASKTFTDTLKRLILDRNTHQKVKLRAAGLVKEWTTDFQQDETLGIMGDTYDALLAKGIQFEVAKDEGPLPVSDAVLKREEEELQRAIAESEREAAHRQPVGGGGAPYHSAMAGPSSSSVQASVSQKPLPAVQNATSPYPALESPPPARTSSYPPVMATSTSRGEDKGDAPTKVRALYDFDPDPDQPGELPLRKGDVIRIIDSAFQEWWRGELRGRIGIFPVNYVEVIPEPSADMLLAEAQYEANVFAQAGEVDRLLLLLQQCDPETGNVGDNDELSDLYQRCLMLRPKVLKLVEKYTSKKNELLDINSRFMTAKSDYEAMVEEGWRRHHADQLPQGQYSTGSQPPPHAYSAALQPHPPVAQTFHSGPPQFASPVQMPAEPHQASSFSVSSPAPGQPQPFYDHESGQWYYPTQPSNAAAQYQQPPLQGQPQQYGSAASFPQYAAQEAIVQ